MKAKDKAIANEEKSELSNFLPVSRSAFGRKGSADACLWC
jgi:hypothetical protein